jgi:hypothetical protein
MSLFRVSGHRVSGHRVSGHRVSGTVRLLTVAALALAASGCSWIDSIGEAEAPPPGAPLSSRANTAGLAGMSNAANPAAGQAVNSYLWRAALDTLSFMPVVQADPYGGVILTDWFSPAGADQERFKVNLYILDAALRADGVRASVFRQVFSGGSWRDVAVTPETQTQLEDTILTRARQLRIAATPAQ